MFNQLGGAEVRVVVFFCSFRMALLLLTAYSTAWVVSFVCDVNYGDNVGIFVTLKHRTTRYLVYMYVHRILFL